MGGGGGPRWGQSPYPQPSGTPTSNAYESNHYKDQYEIDLLKGEFSSGTEF